MGPDSRLLALIAAADTVEAASPEHRCADSPGHRGKRGRPEAEAVEPSSAFTMFAPDSPSDINNCHVEMEVDTMQPLQKRASIAGAPPQSLQPRLTPRSSVDVPTTPLRQDCQSVQPRQQQPQAAYPHRVAAAPAATILASRRPSVGTHQQQHGTSGHLASDAGPSGNRTPPGSPALAPGPAAATLALARTAAAAAAAGSAAGWHHPPSPGSMQPPVLHRASSVTYPAPVAYRYSRCSSQGASARGAPPPLFYAQPPPTHMAPMTPHVPPAAPYGCGSSPPHSHAPARAASELQAAASARPSPPSAAPTSAVAPVAERDAPSRAGSRSPTFEAAEPAAPLLPAAPREEVARTAVAAQWHAATGPSARCFRRSTGGAPPIEEADESADDAADEQPQPDPRHEEGGAGPSIPAGPTRQVGRAAPLAAAPAAGREVLPCCAGPCACRAAAWRASVPLLYATVPPQHGTFGDMSGPVLVRRISQAPPQGPPGSRAPHGCWVAVGEQPPLAYAAGCRPLELQEGGPERPQAVLRLVEGRAVRAVGLLPGVRLPQHPVPHGWYHSPYYPHPLAGQPQPQFAFQPPDGQAACKPQEAAHRHSFDAASPQPAPAGPYGYVVRRRWTMATAAQPGDADAGNPADGGGALRGPFHAPPYAYALHHAVSLDRQQQPGAVRLATGPPPHPYHYQPYPAHHGGSASREQLAAAVAAAASRGGVVQYRRYSGCSGYGQAHHLYQAPQGVAAAAPEPGSAACPAAVDEAAAASRRAQAATAAGPGSFRRASEPAAQYQPQPPQQQGAAPPARTTSFEAAAAGAKQALSLAAAAVALAAGFAPAAREQAAAAAAARRAAPTEAAPAGGGGGHPAGQQGGQQVPPPAGALAGMVACLGDTVVRLRL